MKINEFLHRLDEALGLDSRIILEHNDEDIDMMIKEVKPNIPEWQIEPIRREVKNIYINMLRQSVDIDLNVTKLRDVVINAIQKYKGTRLLGDPSGKQPLAAKAFTGGDRFAARAAEQRRIERIKL